MVNIVIHTQLVLWLTCFFSQDLWDGFHLARGVIFISWETWYLYNGNNGNQRHPLWKPAIRSQTHYGNPMDPLWTHYRYHNAVAHCVQPSCANVPCQRWPCAQLGAAPFAAQGAGPTWGVGPCGCHDLLSFDHDLSIPVLQVFNGSVHVFKKLMWLWQSILTYHKFMGDNNQ